MNYCKRAMCECLDFIPSDDPDVCVCGDDIDTHWIADAEGADDDDYADV